MPVRPRQAPRPDRSIASADAVGEPDRQALLAKRRYVGTPNHKLGAGDYAFVPSHNPRPSKSVCDDLGPIRRDQAVALFRRGLALGMISRVPPGGVPKYVWAVDEAGEVYEAKTKPDRETDCHGYRLGEDDRLMRATVLKAWRRRCPRD